MLTHKKFFQIEELEELFVDVQMQRILPDQKTFTDVKPKYAVKEILEQYRSRKFQKDFSLSNFIADHFEQLQYEEEKAAAVNNKTIEEHITQLWNTLTKYPEDTGGTLIPLPHKFIVPGGRFGEIYYWDSYFTMLGLQVSKRIDLIESMINNFAYLIDLFGFVPNGNRTYFLSRSQPPFFSLMVALLSEETGDEVFIKYLPQLTKEYDFWMKDKETLTPENRSVLRVVLMPDGTVLNRYWDSLDTPRPESYAEDLETAAKAGSANNEIFRHIRAACESGWDFSTRWFKDKENLHTIHTADIIPVDLNSLLFHLEKTLAFAHELAGDKDLSEKFYQKSKEREAAIQKYLWREEDETFMDYDFLINRHTGVATVCAGFPMFIGFATEGQSAKVAKQLEQKFLQPGGLLTTLVYSRQQWDAPNGWAPLQWVNYKGLLDYGYYGLAEKIKTNWTSTIERVFEKTGRITEKYNVVDTSLGAGGGEYLNQDGFGWTNGVYLKMKSFG